MMLTRSVLAVATLSAMCSVSWTAGRRTRSGAPLSGTEEFDEPDFTVLDSTGLPAMPDFAHVTRARMTDPRFKILRRPYNYDEAPDVRGDPTAGSYSRRTKLT